MSNNDKKIGSEAPQIARNLNDLKIDTHIADSCFFIKTLSKLNVKWIVQVDSVMF